MTKVITEDARYGPGWTEDLLGRENSGIGWGCVQQGGQGTES